MKRIIVKLIIALCFGIIVGEVVGMNTRHFSYYYEYNSGDKKEISKSTYEKYLNTSESDYVTKKEPLKDDSFNKRNFLFWGSLTFSVLSIILLFPELRNKHKES